MTSAITCSEYVNNNPGKYIPYVRKTKRQLPEVCIQYYKFLSWVAQAIIGSEKFNLGNSITFSPRMLVKVRKIFKMGPHFFSSPKSDEVCSFLGYFPKMLVKILKFSKIVHYWILHQILLVCQISSKSDKVENLVIFGLLSQNFQKWSTLLNSPPKITNQHLFSGDTIPLLPLYRHQW